MCVSKARRIKDSAAHVGDWLQRIEAAAVALAWIGSASGGGWLVAQWNNATAAQAYIWALGAGAIGLIAWSFWRQGQRQEAPVTPTVAGPVPPDATGDRKERIRRYRQMVQAVHEQSLRPENESKSVTWLLEQNLDFLEFRPYLSTSSFAAIYHRTIIIPPGRSEMDGTLDSILGDIDKLEESWGLREPRPSVAPETQNAPAKTVDPLKGFPGRVYAIVSAHDSRPLSVEAVHVRWHETTKRLDIAVVNTAPDTLRDFRLFVSDIRKYNSATKQFVETRLFHSAGPFVELQLLNPEHLRKNQIGALTDLFCDEPATFNFLQYDDAQLWFQGRSAAASLEDRWIRESGIWLVTLRCEASQNSRSENLMFEWHEIGHSPRPYEFPKPPRAVSKAYPPIKPVR